jgi:hypothetical protein
MRKRIIKSIIFLVIGLVTLFILKPIVNEDIKTITDNPEYSGTFVQGVIQIFPIMLFVCLAIGSFAIGLGKDVGQEIGYDWKSYGERLKLAYAAKFGGRNMGFENEVDYRIKIMIDTDKGFAREVAKDWLKRMSKFTSIDWLSLENSNEKA